MTSMTDTPASVSTATNTVIAGVDTHGETHHAAVLDELGRELADQEFPAAPSGYAAMLSWLRGHGHLERIGVEGTGTYGAGLQRYLRENAVAVVEVDRPDRRARRARGKSDPLDAYAAARAALNGQASATPKTRDGRVEAIRALRVARSGAVKARTQAINQLKALLVSAPSDLREPCVACAPPSSSTPARDCAPAANSTTLGKRPSSPCGVWPDAARRSPRRSPTPTATSRASWQSPHPNSWS